MAQDAGTVRDTMEELRVYMLIRQDIALSRNALAALAAGAT